MGNPLEEELSEAEDYNNRVVRFVSKSLLLSTNTFYHQYGQCNCYYQHDNHWSGPKQTNPFVRVLSELQKLDGLPVIRGDQEEEEASHNLIISFHGNSSPVLFNKSFPRVRTGQSYHIFLCSM